MPKTTADTGAGLDIDQDENTLIDNLADMLSNEMDGAEDDAPAEPSEPTEGDETYEGEGEDEGAGEDDGEGEGEGEGGEGEGEGEGDGEGDLSVAIKINGKKSDLGELLKLTTHYPVVGGEELEVSYEELVNGYQRGKDYANKTTEIKQIKNELQPYIELVAHAKHDPQFVQYIQSYFQNGPFPEAANNPDLRVGDAELAEMLDEGSDKYDPQRAQQVVKARKDFITAREARKGTEQKVREETQARFKEWADAEADKAQDIVKSLGGDLNKDAALLVSSLREAGFTDQEILQLTDSRMTITAWKAAKYDELIKSKSQPRTTLSGKRRTLAAPRVAKASQGKRDSTQARHQRDTLRTAVKTQKEEDWVNAIAARLKI